MFLIFQQFEPPSFYKIILIKETCSDHSTTENEGKKNEYSTSFNVFKKNFVQETSESFKNPGTMF